MVDSVGDMVNEIEINTTSTIINELNQLIKNSPDRSGKYHIHKNSIEGLDNPMKINKLLWNSLKKGNEKD